MKYQALSLAFSALALSMAAPAMADTVNFDDLTPGDGITRVYNSPLSSGAFTFDSTPGHQLLVWSDWDLWGDYTAPLNADPHGATLSTQDSWSVITGHKTDNSSFTLNSIDFADIYNGSSGGSIRVTFNFAAGGSSYQDLTLGAGLNTYDFDMVDLSSFTVQGLTTLAGLLQMDNVVYDLRETVGPGDGQGDPSPTPEPASWALMLGGFGAVGYSLRRRVALAKLA